MSAFPFQNEEQGESLGAAEIGEALGCYAYSGAWEGLLMGSKWQKHRDR